MKKKTVLQFVAVVIFIFFFTGIKITYSNTLEKRDDEIIRIAYMNGSIDALRMDLDKIKKIQKNDALFKSTVFAAADNYIKKVESLSGKSAVIKNNLGGTYYKSW